MRISSHHCLCVGAFGVNCSLVALGDRALIVDPGAEAGRLADTLAKLHLTPAAILLTHAHFDHIGAVPDLLARFPQLKVYVHPKDIPAFSHPLNQYPPDYPPVVPDPSAPPAWLSALTDVAALATDFPNVVEVIETPGHTPGCVCYRFADDALLLAGDTLFAGSVGRTDLPGGNMSTLLSSLAKLKTLPPKTHVVPGHGPFTTIADEIAGNPYLQH